MKAQEGHIESTTAIAGMCRATSLTEAMGIVSPHHCSKPHDQSFTVRQPLVPFLFDFLGPSHLGSPSRKVRRRSFGYLPGIGSLSSMSTFAAGRRMTSWI